MERKCSRCKNVFETDSDQYYCKQCRSKYNKPRKGEKRHGIITSEQATKISRRYRKKYPERYTAFLMVKKALRSGELKRKVCERCQSDKVLAHHADYSKPLQVNWLCLRHHNEIHGL